MTDFERIIAEAAAVARQARGQRTHAVPRLDDVLAEATKVVKTRDRMRRRRRMAQHAREDLERQSTLFASQTQAEDAMDFCVLREEAVRGKPWSYTSAQCRVEYALAATVLPPHVHAGHHRNTPGVCVYTALCYRCGKVLPGQNRRWCSNACSILWWTNHLWTEASAKRRKMDNAMCVRCGAKGGDLLPDAACNLCGDPWPCEQYTRSGTAHSLHRPESLRVLLEVNHKDPRVGRGYDKGCAHHLDGLETLCHPCHVIETNKQRRERSDAKMEAHIKALGFDVKDLGLDVDHPPKGIPL